LLVWCGQRTVSRLVAAVRKKPQIRASEVVIDNRTLEAVLLDVAEQNKLTAQRFEQVAERSAQAEQRAAEAAQLAAEAAQRAARAEELATIALQTIAAVSQDLRAMTQEMREENARARIRLDALEKAGA
jgi:hypothetical protein